MRKDGGSCCGYHPIDDLDVRTVWHVFGDVVVYESPFDDGSYPAAFNLRAAAATTLPIPDDPNTVAFAATSEGALVWHVGPRPSSRGEGGGTHSLRRTGAHATEPRFELGGSASVDAVADDGRDFFYIGRAGARRGLAMVDARGAAALRVALSYSATEPNSVHLALGDHTVWYAVDGEVASVARTGIGEPIMALPRSAARPIADLLVDNDVGFVARGKTIVRADDASNPLVEADDVISAFARIDSSRWAWCAGRELVVQR